MKRTKKLLAVALAVTMLLSSSLCVSASAGKPAIYSKSINTSGNITAKVKSAGATGIYAKLTTIKSKGVSTGRFAPGAFTITNTSDLTWYRLDMKGYTEDYYYYYYGPQLTTYLAKSPDVSLNRKSSYSRKFVVRWDKQSGASGYKVYMKKGTGSWQLKKTTTGSSYTTGTLSKYVKYYFKVVSYKKIGGKTYKSIPLNYVRYGYFY